MENKFNTFICREGEKPKLEDYLGELQGDIKPTIKGLISAIQHGTSEDIQTSLEALEVTIGRWDNLDKRIKSLME